MVSVEAFNRSLSQRVSLNRQILKNKYWLLPVDDAGHENYQPVGRGDKTSDFCGVHVSYYVCKDVEAHKGVVVDGVDYTGKIVVRHKHLWCHKSSCPVCFIRGWSVRGARFIEGRLLEGVKRGFGEVEHIVVSVPSEDYGLSELVLRKKARVALKVRGVSGGCMIFHGFRMDRERDVLVWRPHYHVLGFIDGGFDVCRDCVHERKECRVCSGFKGREMREYEKDKYIVKVMDKRETIFGSAWYQNHHSTIRVGVKRFHVVTWFGCCGYNNFKGEKLKLKAEVSCPVCHGEMVRSAYVGERRIAKNVGDVDYVSWFGEDACHSCDYVDVVGSGGFG